MKKFRDPVLFFIFLILLIIVTSNLNDLWMGPKYEFTTAAGAFFGHDGRVIVTDNGKTALSVVESDNKLSRLLHGGTPNKFYYAQGAAEGDDGTLYIADQAYITGDDDKTYEEYRVVRYRSGKYQVIYSTGDNIIREVRFYKGSLYVLRDDETGIALYRIDGDNEAQLVRRTYIGDVLSDASCDLETGAFVVSTKRGAVRMLTDGQESWTTLKHDEKHLMPMSISAMGGKVWFSEIYSGKVCFFNEDNMDEVKTVYLENDLKISDLSASLDGTKALGVDYLSYYTFSIRDDGSFNTDYTEPFEYSAFYRTVLLWLAVLLCVIIALWLLRFLPGALMGLLHNESALRMSAVVVAVVTVSCFLAWSLIYEEHQKEDESDVSSMKLFADLAVNNIDVDLIKNIDSEASYGGSSYVQLRSMLDLLMAEAFDQGKDYYYVLYGVDNGRACYLMNYYDTIMCTEPFGKIDSSYYLDVYETGKSYALKSRDADGLWLYVITPIFDEQGEFAAILEIGMDLSFRTSERRAQTRDIIINVFCSSAVMMMLIIEALFFMTFVEKRRDYIKSPGKNQDVTRRVPLRTIILLTYMAATIQDAFITVLSSKLYPGNLPISDEMASGLPLSANLLMMALAGLFTAHLTEKLGSRMILFLGIFVELSGFVVCAVTGTYYGLLIGNVLVGTGLGIINVTCNTLAAMGDTMEETAQAFADVMAGILSGLTIGAGVASLLYPLGGSRLSYTVAACFMIPAIFIVRSVMDMVTESLIDKNTYSEKAEAKESTISFGRFFFNIRVLGFFLLILVPFMTSISYREYFFPMFASENALAEERIGQIYLLCGLLVIYVGPHISSWVIKHMGTFWSIIFASILMAGNMLLFVIKPGMLTVLAGVVILSVITSFAYTCQYTYFEQLPDSIMYGDGKSMGVYSVFENAGQTIGPMVYGALIAMGYRNGIGVFCAVLFVFTLLYVLLMGRQKKIFR